MDMPAGARTQNIKGKTYVFIDTPFWNAEKRRGEHKRNYIGKIEQNGFVPNSRYLISLQAAQPLKRGPVPAEECRRLFYGATYLLDQIGSKLGITEDLKAAFPEHYQQILSVSYFLVLEDGASAYRFHKWGLTHRHPAGGDISSQRISDLFASVTEASKMEFFRRQAKRRSEKEYLAFDTTSISSYSELIHQAKYGKNKEGDDLPQVNLALLYGELSRLPVYFRKLAGNISDVTTIRNLIRDIDFLDMEKLNFVLDRGFFSESNINDMMKHHHKFLIGASVSLKIIRKHLDNVRGEKLISWENYHDDTGLYIMSFSDEWDYQEEKSRTGETVEAKKRIYIKRGIRITPREDAIRKRQLDFGYFALMSNGIKDPVEAIRIYRTRDLIEKSFANLKERLDMRRMSVSSAENFEGKLFVQFVALMYLSYIKKMMEKHGLFNNYTMESLLDDLDIIEYYQQPGKAHHLSEITKKQAALYDAMEVSQPE